MVSEVVFIAPSIIHPNSGSALLRGEQLRQLVAPYLERHGIATRTTQGTEFRDALLILGKNVLLATSAKAIERLRRRGNIVCADPLDGTVPDEVLARADILLAASKMQMRAFAPYAARQRVAYVGHHVDLRIGAVRVPDDRFRMAYFGEIFNARHFEALSDTVTFVRTDTARADNVAWMAQLTNFNAHYAVRARQAYDGFKPFTKGFVAAHCGCPILVDADDAEARLFLPNDYPYFADGGSVDSVRDVIRRMAAEFRGPLWRQAEAAMHALRATGAPEIIGRQLYDAIAPALARIGARK
ncbi:MAG: hypothetical protein AB7P50_05535 [Alphaproteobacteria bacterium]